ncbi:MAG: GntR family transcriptional regulator [Proteobacteria bacterium]|nr:GntR family transcriptional regulator [Pseudomonadota bacterium]
MDTKALRPLDRNRDGARPRTPIYVQVQDRIQELIGGPDFGPGDRVPSERSLAEELGINRMTVRKAIERLVDIGLLERNGTSGTRIPVPRVMRPVEGHGFSGITRIIRSAGGTPGNKLLHFELGRATAKVASRLAIAEGAELVLVRRLWTVNETPFCIETSHLPAALIPDLHAEDLTAGQSLYGLIKTRHNIDIASSERLIAVALLTEMEARLLRLKAGGPALLLRLVAFDQTGRPIEYMTSVNHPQLVVFKTAKAETTW